MVCANSGDTRMSKRARVLGGACGRLTGGANHAPLDGDFAGVGWLVVRLTKQTFFRRVKSSQVKSSQVKSYGCLLFLYRLDLTFDEAKYYYTPPQHCEH